jgi:uncharacterized protein
LLFGAIVAAIGLGGCARRSTSKSEIRAVTAEIVSAAEQATQHRSEITIRPEIRQSSGGANGQLIADDIYVSVTDPSQAGVLKQRLGAIAQLHKLSIGETAAGGAARLDFMANGVRTHSVHLIPPPARALLPSRPLDPASPNAPRLAIIIDDLGRDLAPADSLLALPFPVTCSVLPNLPFSREVAEQAYRRGDEVILHLPMESQSEGEGSEGTLPEPAELRVGMSASQVAVAVDRMLETVPHASGVNNHEGSRATADPALMQTLMPLLRERGLFFIDSRTTGATVAYDTAESSGVRAASRKVFLDDTATRDAVLSQLDLAIRDAIRNGSAIAIGHPHAATIAALSQGVPKLEAQGVRLVFASDLVH